MSDRMTPMPFAQLMQWMMKERERTGSIFGVYRPYKAKAQYDRTLFGRKLETPVGPAAGPTPSWRRILRRHTTAEDVSSS